MSKNIEIWTDGACKGNPGPGGWGALIFCDGREIELCGGEQDTTNNRMELMAVIESLKYVKECHNDLSKIKITVDSQYVMNAFTQKWLENWQKNGWKTASKSPVKNKDLWMQLLDLVDLIKPTWAWIKGHSGDPYNDRADKLANQGLEKIK